MSDDLKITPAQTRTIAALLTHRTIEEAAKAAGVTPRTITRWLENRNFCFHLAGAEANVIDQATRQLIALQGDAIQTMAGIMDDGKVSPAVRLRAAQAILDTVIRLRELRNVEARLLALEAAINDAQFYAENRSNRTYR